MRLRAIRIDSFRSLGSFEIRLGDQVNAILGPNGVGKTNFLEAVFFALTGRSFRTNDRRDLIPFGSGYARSEAEIVTDDDIVHDFAAAVSRSEGRRHSLDGESVEARVALSHRPPVLVFSPDRLVIVKGPPGERRAHLDGLIGALRPSRLELRRRYGQTLAQRNAMLSRVSTGRGAESELAAWDDALARAAVPLIEARIDTLDQIKPHFSAIAVELGLGDNSTLSYQARFTGTAEEMAEELATRRQMDLEQSRTTLGPHLDDVLIEKDGHSLRRFGSQGQQRLALLTLLMAEREALMETWARPLLLLDDVLSELDPSMRDRLESRLAKGGQSLITGADPDSLPTSGDVMVIELAGDPGTVVPTTGGTGGSP